MPELVCAADDPRWLDERRKGVTATDITAIIGISPYESEYSLYWKKLGHIPDVHEDTPRLRLGRELEPIIMGRYGDAHPEACYTLGGPELWRSSARPWQMATPDALLFDGTARAGTGREIAPAAITGVLEVKSWADADRTSWDDGPPPRVRAQVLWQMDTLDVATGHVGVLFLPSGEFRSYVIEHDHETVDEESTLEIKEPCGPCNDQFMMRIAGEEFMARIRHELPPPSPDASTATLAALKARFADPRKDKQAEIDRQLWGKWATAKDVHAAQEEMIRGYEAEIREQAGDAGILTVAGIPVARHTVSHVKEHVRKAGTRDSITRIRNGETE